VLALELCLGEGMQSVNVILDTWSHIFLEVPLFHGNVITEWCSWSSRTL